MDSKALRRKADDLLAKYQAAVALAAGENRELSDEEKKLKADADRLESLAKDLAATETQRAAYSQSAGDVPRIDQGNVQVGAPNHEKDPKHGFKNNQDYMLAVLKAGQGGGVDERLQALGVKKLAAGSDEQGIYSDPAGGFFIPDALIPGVKEVTWEGDPTSGRTMSIPMTTPSVSINARVDKDHSSSVSGGLVVYRRTETQTAAASRALFEQVKLEADPLMGIAYATSEVLAYSPVSFAAILSQGFRTQFGSKMIDEKFRGTGVGQFMGILNSPCKLEIAGESGQTADTIVYANLVKMRSRIWGAGSAVWMYNADCLEQLMTMVTPAGQLVWQTSARDGSPGAIFGLPAVECEVCSALGDAADLVLVNWMEYLEGTLKPLTDDSSIHVRFLNDETAFRFTMSNAGAPWWKTYLTPKHGQTKSPIVTLGARA